MRVIVLDAYNRMGLASINALAPKNEVIGGAVGEPFGPPWLERQLRSRKFKAFFRYPSPVLDWDGYAEAIVDACKRFQVDAVFPASTQSAFALSRLREKLGATPAVFVIEDAAKIERYADKWRLFELCRELDLPFPKTVLPTGDGLAELDELTFPVVAKPRAGEASRGLKVIASRPELDAFLADLPRVGNLESDEYPYLVQEIIQGKEIHDVKGVAEKGRLVAILTAQRVLMRSEFGGAGIVHMTTHAPDLVEIGEKVVGSLDWSGPFDLECIRTRDGTYVPLDGNPRVWGSTHLSVALGQNIPQLAVDVFTKGDVPAIGANYPAGVLLRWKTVGSVAMCFRPPRSPGAVARRLNLLLMPRRQVVSDVTPANYRHLIGMTLDTKASQKRRGKSE
ncbi:MAG: ATP-grasp domain-containing protein [Gaiellales bacterium]